MSRSTGCKLRDTCTTDSQLLCMECYYHKGLVTNSHFKYNGVEIDDFIRYAGDICYACVYEDKRRNSFPCKFCGKKNWSYYRPDLESITNKITGELEVENMRAKRRMKMLGFAVGLVFGAVASYAVCTILSAIVAIVKSL